MSARQAGGAIGIVVGIVAIIAAIPSGGASLSGFAALQSGLAIFAGATMVGVGIYSLAFAPKAPSASRQSSQDLQYATAADGVPLPVIFGEVRVVGNFMNYTVDNFRSKNIPGRSGKGGDSGPAQSLGTDYFLYYEYGLCMGSVDELVQVYEAPGENKMMGQSPTAVVYSSVEDYKEVTLDSIDPTGSNGAQGGIVRLYRGSPEQLRIVAGDPYNYGTLKISGRLKLGYQYRVESQSLVDFTAYGAASNDTGDDADVFTCDNTSADFLTADDSVTEYTGLNYRNICWALFMDFKIGRFPRPQSYHFVLRRRPAHNGSYEMLRPDGTAITGFKTRGSDDNSKPAYHQANPAAVLYECLTNTLWGRALPQDMFDEASWVAVSQYFAARHIGMSFTLEAQEKIGSVVDGIRSQLKTIMTWDGEFLKLRCLLDLTTTHGSIQTIKASEVTSIKPVRPLWHSTVNEIRAEFVNRTKNYRSDAVHVMDLGNYQMTGRANTERIQLSGLTDFNTARRQAFRILRESSYPASGYEIVMNRFKSQIEVGDVVQIWWDEYDQPTTVYALVQKIEDSSSTEDDIKLVAIEDQTLVPAVGHEAVPTIPSVAAWEQIPDVDESELGLWTGQPLVSPTGNYPFVVLEIPAILRTRLELNGAINTVLGGKGFISVIAQRPVTYSGKLYVYAARETNYNLIQVVKSWAIAGNLTADYKINRYIDRSATGFTFSLFDQTKDEAELLSLFSGVKNFSDDIESIINDTGPFAVIGDEIIQIGFVAKIGANEYRATNIVRGRFGTPIADRLDTAQIMFFESFTDKLIALTSNQNNSMADNGFNYNIRFKATADLDSPREILMLNGDYVQFNHPSTRADGTDDTTRFKRLSDAPMTVEFRELVDAGSTWTLKVRKRLASNGAGTTRSFYSSVEFLYTSTVSPPDYQFRIWVRDAVENKAAYLAYDAVTIVETAGVLTDNSSGIISIEDIPKTFIRFDDSPLNIYDTDEIFVETIVNGIISLYDLKIADI